MFLSILERRRSIRKYQAKPVEQEKIDQLVEAALRSPSSRGFNPWEFVVVTDKALIEKLSEAKPHGSSFLKNAPLGIVVCGDPDRSDVWIEDTSIAGVLIHLAAESLGLGSCWIQIRERPHDDRKTAEAYIREVLGLPAHLKVEAIIAVGYAGEQKPAHPKEDLQYEKISFDRYGKTEQG